MLVFYQPNSEHRDLNLETGKDILVKKYTEQKAVAETGHAGLAAYQGDSGDIFEIYESAGDLSCYDGFPTPADIPGNTMRLVDTFRVKSEVSMDIKNEIKLPGEDENDE